LIILIQKQKESMSYKTLKSGIWLILFVSIPFIAHCSSSGEKLFSQYGCINCHSFEGKGGGVGPDLSDVRYRKTDAEIRAQMNNPELYNPFSQMPSFEKRLSEREKKTIIQYIMKK